MLDTRTLVDGNSIRYLDSCSPGPPVILLHGLGGYADKWMPVIELLSASYRVVAPDMIGYGQSDKPVADYTPEFLVSFLREFISAVGFERPNIVGASLGGQVAVEFAATNKQSVSKLVLVSPAGMMKCSTPALDAYIMAALYPRENSVAHALQLMEGSQNEPPEKLVKLFISNMRRPNAKMAFMSSLLCFRNSKGVSAYLDRVDSPTLLVWGHDDPIIPVSYASKFREAISRCTFATIPNCGHTPYVQYPDRFADIVSGFLSSGPGTVHVDA